MKIKKHFLFLFLFGLFLTELAAQKEKINWISFEQLADSLAANPKKVFISFSSKSCSYCKKMNNVAFKNKEVIKLLNTRYYAVKMDAETEKTIVFDGVEYTNTQVGKKRNPIHQIPLLLASRKNKLFTVPATLVLSKTFKLSQRYFEYLSTEKLLQILTH